MSDSTIEDIWEIKYRPKSLAHVILPQSYRAYFEKHIKGGATSIPHLLLTSVPGTGKTTTINALVNDLGWESLFLNGNVDNSIDLLREEGKIHTFASYVALNEKPKVIIIEEFQKLSPSLQAGLKVFMETTIGNIRIFASSNDTSSIDKALLSRFTPFDFNFNSPDLRKEMNDATIHRVSAVLTHLGCKFDINVVTEIVYKFSPEIRSVFKVLKLSYDMYGEINENALRMSVYDDVLIEYIIGGDYVSARNYMLSGKDYNGVWDYMFNKLIPMYSDNPAISLKLITIISEYMYRQSVGVVSQDINFCDAVSKLILVTRSK